MTLPPLPARPSDGWELGPAFEKSSPIYSVSAHAGRVLVGASGLYRLRAGAQGWQHREVPEHGGAWKVAQEPWAPWRQAMASEEGIAILVGKEGEGRIAHIRPKDPENYVANLAWGRVGSRSALFALWENGEVMRIYPDKGKHEILGLPEMLALAADSRGTLAMLAHEGMAVYLMDGGPKAQFRAVEPPQDWLDALPDPMDMPFHIAVAGKAVAVSVGWEGAFVTRDLVAQPFVKSEPLASAGALAFEGTSSDAALYGVILTDAMTSIVRVDASGQAVRIGDVLPEKGPACPFDEIAWDESRRRLFAVHRQAGLVVATAPDAKGGKLAAPN